MDESVIWTCRTVALDSPGTIFISVAKAGANDGIDHVAK